MNNELKLILCPADEISAYIDGELAAEREIELGLHFASCKVCTEELNLQKQFLCGLNSSLKLEGGLELPADFARHVVANAESTVTGLRRPRELYNAIFICTALLLFVMFALGPDAGRIFKGASAGLDQVTAVGSFFGRLIYEFFVGVSIIVRSLVSQIGLDGNGAFALTATAVGCVLLISKKMLRMHRA